MATENFYVRAEDGWVQIADAANFLRVSGVPRNASFYVFHSSSGEPPYNATHASGTITFTGQPTADDTVTVRGIEYTFVVTPVEGTDVEIGADADETAANLATTITQQDTTFVAASADTGVVTVTAVTYGTEGNTYTLAEDADNVAVSGATLTGAVDAAVGILVDGCDPLFVDVAYTGSMWARVLNSLPDKPLRIDVLSIG